MSAPFIEVASKTTKQKQMVPQEWLDHPVIGKDFTPTAAGKEQLRLNGGPSQEWTVAELEAYADDNGVDHTGLTKKAELLNAISGGPALVGQEHTGSTGPGGVPVDAENPQNGVTPDTDPSDSSTDPAAGEKE